MLVMAKDAKRPRGRPRAEKPMSVQVAFRVDEEVAQAIDRLRDRWGVVSFSTSDVAREVLLRALKAEGLLR